MPHAVAEIDRRVEAEINRQIAVPIVGIRAGRRLLLRFQRNRRAARCAAAGGLHAVIIVILPIIQRIRHVRVAAHWIAGRRRQNRNRVGAGREIIEQIFAAAGGRLRQRHRIARAVHAGQRHAHAVKANFAAIEDAVVIGVMPHEIADAHRLIQPGIPRQVVFARNQRRLNSLAGRCVRVAVIRISRACRRRILRAEHVAGRRRERDLIRSRNQIIKQILPIAADWY